MKWKLRSCPRCGGDIYFEKDFDVWYETCLQCGYHCELESLKVLLYELERDNESDPENIHLKTR